MSRSAALVIAWVVLVVCFLTVSSRLVAQEGTEGANAKSTAGHGQAADHIETDPTHGFAGADLPNPLAWRADGAVFTLVVFLMLLTVLWAFAWKPIKEGLEKRELAIASQIADAKKSADDAAATLKDYQAKLLLAQTQAQELVAQARKDAEVSGQRILAEARSEAIRQRDRALAEIESAKQGALSDIAVKSTDLAFSLARQVVGRELNMDDHKQLIQEALKQMPNRN